MTRTDGFYDRDFEALFNNACELLGMKSPSNWTTVERALNSAAEAVRPWAQGRRAENGGRGPWCIHDDCAHWFEPECGDTCLSLSVDARSGETS